MNVTPKQLQTEHTAAPVGVESNHHQLQRGA
jgi:hypothetical protein